MEQKAATLEMLNEVCQDLRLEWPGSNRDKRGKSRFGVDEELLNPTKLTSLGD
jgi:hypothetical protein